MELTKVGLKKQRQSNFELYRIVCMFLIIAHHYVGAYGILGGMGLTEDSPSSANSIYLHLFGMWGKTGINCFVLITGYFMCQRSISLRKFLKLYLWIITYSVTISAILLVTGRMQFSYQLLLQLFPITKIHSDNFVSAFLVWWLFIPFLNVLINGLSERQHRNLIALMVVVFTIYPFIPKLLFIQVNPICWFSTLFVIASYIKKYPRSIYKSCDKRFWMFGTFILIVISMISVIAILFVNTKYHLSLPKFYFVADSQMPLALAVSVASFMWFKNINITQSKQINDIGASTFGILLLHTHSAELRNLLWNDILHCPFHYNLSLLCLIGHSIIAVLAILMVGTLVDRLRFNLIEKPVFKLFDPKVKLNS